MDTDPQAQAARLSDLLRTFPGGNAKLASEIGVSLSQVSRWRQGHVRLKWARCEQIAPVLGVTPGELYAGVPGWMPPHLARAEGTGEPSPTELQGQADFDMRRIDQLVRQVADLTERLDREDASKDAEPGPEALSQVDVLQLEFEKDRRRVDRLVRDVAELQRTVLDRSSGWDEEAHAEGATDDAESAAPGTTNQSVS